MTKQTIAPGKPGIPPTWSSSDKDFVTTSLGASRLWVTVGHGVINEVFWPSTGRPRLRDLTFYLVGEAKWVDLKRVARYRLSRPSPTLPLLTIVHEGEDYALTLEILPDTARDALLVHYQLRGRYRVVIIAAPRLSTDESGDTAWVDGELFASGGSDSLCLAVTDGFDLPSVGYVGVSDGWQDLNQHRKLTFAYDRAESGNVALTGALRSSEGVIALAFGETSAGARTLARSSLADPIDTVRAAFLDGWTEWREQSGLHAALESAKAKGGGDLETRLLDEALFSATVLKTHEDRTYPGALVASLSVPWGSTTNSLGGYHLVWPRDATLAAFAFIAIGQLNDAARILAHLQTAQQADGHWPQNYYPSGDSFWTKLQIDETAFPVLLAAKLREVGHQEARGTPQMVRKAIGFIARSGPSSEQDRWEENPGLNPFTLGTVIAALIAGQPWLEPDEQTYAMDLADDWNARLEDWCYVGNSDLTRKLGVAGYYIRIASDRMSGDGESAVVLRNRMGERINSADLVALDFSYLVRLGLRDPRDPRILDTIKVVDQVLRVDSASGALYHRYTDDGYGEHEDGSAFDGHGIGRGWPLLTGERGHLALAAGDDCRPYLQTMLNCASAGGLLPEQVWDGPTIAQKGLVSGRPSSSAMPLLWAHAEYLKLFVARHTGKPVEMLLAVAGRYNGKTPHSETVHWRTLMPITKLGRRARLAIEDERPFTLQIRWDRSAEANERVAKQGAFGVWSVTFQPDKLTRHMSLEFKRRYDRDWEAQEHLIDLAPSGQQAERSIEQAE